MSDFLISVFTSETRKRDVDREISNVLGTPHFPGFCLIASFSGEDYECVKVKCFAMLAFLES